MSYLSLYRKYRSQTFSDLIGQNHVVKTLQNGILTGRIAHAYLFTGPRGTGKTSTARLLAKALCCESGPTSEPDNTCEICTEITAGTFVDVMEMDAASESGVEAIREKIVEVAEYRPMVARYKVFIIDEVHDLSSRAFDALLKTIEEPPPHLIFILATTEFNKVPPTIRSRCQKFEFHRASMQDLTARLSYVAASEGIEAEPAALTAIARMADGGYRDGLTLLEQAILTSEDQRITLHQVYDQLGLVAEEVIDGLLIAVRNAEIPAILSILADVARLGRDPRAILESAMYRLSDLTRASYQLEGQMDASREAALHETAAQLGRDFIVRFRGELADAHKVIRDITLPRLWLESELVRLSQKAARPVVTEDARAEKRARPAEARRAEPTHPVAVVDEPKVAPPQAPKEPLPVGNSPEAVWARLVADLPTKDGKVPKFTLVTRSARFVELAGEELIIEVSRQIDAEWYTDDPKRISTLNKMVNDHGGAGWRVVVRSSGATLRDQMEEPTAVELPAEAEGLLKVARKVFEQNPESS